MMTSNKKLLISAAIFLMVIRFVLVPVFTWQQDLITELESKQARLSKGMNLVERKDQIAKGIKDLEAQKKALLNNYFISERGIDDLKLRSQQRIESLLAEHQLQVRSFNWVSDIPGEIQETRAQVSFIGNTKDVAGLQMALAKAPQLIQVVELSLRLSGLDNKSLGQADGTAVIALYNIPTAEQISTTPNSRKQASGDK